MNAIEAGLSSPTEQEIDDSYPINYEQEILNSLGSWRAANPKKKFPPRKVLIIDGPVNVGKVGFILSRYMGLTQIITGVDEITWYSKWQWEPANGKRRSDYGTQKAN